MEIEKKDENKWVFEKAFTYTQEELEERTQRWNYGEFNEFINNLIEEKEKKFQELCGEMGIRAITKTDKKSLPYTHQYSITNRFSSYVNAVFWTEKLWRKVVLDLLQEGASNIRYYMEVSPDKHTFSDGEERIKGIKFDLFVRMDKKFLK